MKKRVAQAGMALSLAQVRTRVSGARAGAEAEKLNMLAMLRALSSQAAPGSDRLRRYSEIAGSAERCSNPCTSSASGYGLLRRRSIHLARKRTEKSFPGNTKLWATARSGSRCLRARKSSKDRPGDRRVGNRSAHALHCLAARRSSLWETRCGGSRSGYATARGPTTRSRSRRASGGRRGHPRRIRLSGRSGAPCRAPLQ
jgi:hypothetical protein